jgi:triacylglycerol lipase
MAKFDFDSTVTGYDLKNALKMAEMSYLSYKPPPHIKKFMMGKWRFEKFRFFSRKETQAYMTANDELIILAFRGTDSIEDWMTDVDAKLIKGPFGKVHRGFLEALDCVWNDIKKTIIDFQTNSQPFWITGHSLGGALAVLSAARFIEEESKRAKGIYTFGQPRVGNATFAENFDALLKRRTFRFSNNEDIVTRVPPREAGYSHIGSIVYFDSFGQLQRGTGPWKQFLDRSVSKLIRSIDRLHLLREQFPNGLEDHGMDKYIKRIKKNLTSP